MTPYPRRRQALAVLSMSLLAITIANTILNVALPTIRDSLDATSSQQQWIVDAYLLVFAGLLLAAGTLGDRFGRRRALTSGLLIFALGSICAALSDDATTLIASRALMGVGAAAIMPTTLSILTNVFPADERPRAIATWAAVSGLGVALGPTTGGWLLEHFDWNVIFLANLPVVAACLAGVAWCIPESRDPASPPVDWPGVGLSIAGLSAIVWGLIEAPERGWGAAAILGAFGAGALVLSLFVLWERRTSHPMLDVRVFRNPRFSGASTAITFLFFALMGVMFLMTTYLQAVLGHSALETGVRVLAIAAGMIAASKASVGLARRFGTKLVVASGLIIVAVGLTLVSRFEVDTPDMALLMAFFTIGAGMGLAMPPATEAIMGSLPRDKAGVGSAMNDVVREVGGTLGIAVLGSLVTSTYSANMTDAAGGLPERASEAASDSVGAAHAVAADVGGALGARLVQAADVAFVDALSTTALFAAGMAVLGAVIALAFLPSSADAPRVAASADGLDGRAAPEPAAA